VLGVFGDLLGIAQTWLASTVGSRIVLSLRIRLLEHIHQMPLAFYSHADRRSSAA
jgi:ABC-type bacteriocin/lantibiotic exporter with double-glycine peptidase domain